MKQIILASTSPRRKELLQKIGLNFKVVGSHVEEKLNPRLKPRGNVEYLSQLKAKAIADNYPDSIIIAADTFIVFQDEILGKQADEKAAKRTLRRLSGNTHQVMTGFTILDTGTGKSITKSTAANIFMKKMSAKDIDWYVKTGEWKDAAAAYKIQEKGSIFVERIEGDFWGIVGLPLSLLVEELKHFGVYIGIH
jgi:septum formation protein